MSYLYNAIKHSENTKIKDMGQLVLQEEILNKIKSDPTLFGIVAKSLKVSPYTLPSILNKNDVKLTQASTLRAIKEYSGVKDSELLVEIELEPA